MEKYQGNEDPVFRTRALIIKEQRAELVKHHLWVLWTDYFKPPHFEKYPQLHELFNKATKAAGAAAARASVDPAEGQELLDLIAEIDTIFWETKAASEFRTLETTLTSRNNIRWSASFRICGVASLPTAQVAVDRALRAPRAPQTRHQRAPSRSSRSRACGEAPPRPRVEPSPRLDEPDQQGHTDEDRQAAEDDHEVHRCPRLRRNGTPTGLPGAWDVAGVFSGLSLASTNRKMGFPGTPPD